MQEERRQKQALLNLEKNNSVSPKKNKQRDEKLDRLEAFLARARALIKQAALSNRISTSSQIENKDYVSHGGIYRNAYTFQQYYYHLPVFIFFHSKSYNKFFYCP